MKNNSWNVEDCRNNSFHEDDNFPYFIMDKKGKVTDVNDAFCQIVGCTKERIVGFLLKDFDKLTRKSRNKMRRRQILKLFGTVNPNFVLHVNMIDGQTIVLEVHTKPQIKDGRIVGEIGAIQKSQELNLSNKENFNRRELKKTISELEHACSDLELKLRDFNQFQSNLEKKFEEVEIMHEDLDTRNKIIEEIQNQLMLKQTLLVEKTGVVAQMEEGLNDLHREIEIKNEELSVNKNILEERNKELVESKREIENNLEEIRSLNETIVVRDSIINEIKEQLENKQTLLVENVNRDSRIQHDIDQMQNELLSRERELSLIKQEIEDRCNELGSLKDSIVIRDNIIKQMKEQLTEKQITLIEMNESVEKLQSELHNKKIELDKKTDIQSSFEVKGEIGGVSEELESKVTTKMELCDEGFVPNQELSDNIINESGDTTHSDEFDLESKTQVNGTNVFKGDEKEQTQVVESFKLHEEIDKILDRVDDNLKTKKIVDE